MTTMDLIRIILLPCYILMCSKDMLSPVRHLNEKKKNLFPKMSSDANCSWLLTVNYLLAGHVHYSLLYDHFFVLYFYLLVTMEDVEQAYLQKVLKKRGNSTWLVCFQSEIKQIINIPLKPHIQITKKGNQPLAENYFFVWRNVSQRCISCGDAFTNSTKAFCPQNKSFLSVFHAVRPTMSNKPGDHVWHL